MTCLGGGREWWRRGPQPTQPPPHVPPQRLVRERPRDRGANAATTSRSSPIRSTSSANGIAAPSIVSLSSERSRAITWRCSDLRTSTIEKNASTGGPPPATRSESCSNVRDDSVAGMSGTSSASATSNTLSETSEMLGGQSRNM